jgi:hypothetical protein
VLAEAARLVVQADHRNPCPPEAACDRKAGDMAVHHYRGGHVWR